MITCNKCNGTGHIQGFVHVSQGRCFQCNGTGKLVEPKKATVTFSRAFINQYHQSSFFPEDQSGLTKVKCISMEGHPTAESWLMLNCDHYYIGQPVCRASSWYKIPVAEFEEFAKHYQKVCKQNLQ